MNRATRQKLILIRDYLAHRQNFLCHDGAREAAAFLLHEIERIQDALAGKPQLGFTLPPCLEREKEIVDGASSTSMASLETIERRVANLEWLMERQAKDIDSLRTTKRKRPAARPITTDYQAAMLRAASEQAKTTQPVPGWPVVITSNADNHGYFASMRRNHPVKLGEVINSKRVVETFWFNCDEDGDQPVYRLEGEEGYRLASDIAGRITWASCPAPITPPAAPDQQPPTDGGE